MESAIAAKSSAEIVRKTRLLSALRSFINSFSPSLRSSVFAAFGQKCKCTRPRMPVDSAGVSSTLVSWKRLIALMREAGRLFVSGCCPSMIRAGSGSPLKQKVGGGMPPPLHDLYWCKQKNGADIESAHTRVTRVLRETCEKFLAGLGLVLVFVFGAFLFEDDVRFLGGQLLGADFTGNVTERLGFGGMSELPERLLALGGGIGVRGSADQGGLGTHRMQRGVFGVFRKFGERWLTGNAASDLRVRSGAGHHYEHQQSWDDEDEEFDFHGVYLALCWV